MKLIDLLVQELPNRGGWPEGVRYLEQYFDGSLFEESNYQSSFKFKRVDDFEYGTVTREQYESALAESKSPAWNGEGLPPVGCVCEYTKKSLPGNEWTECTVDYVGSSFVVYRDCYGVELTGIKGDIRFRPICAEAERKRDDFIKQVMHWMHHAGETEVGLIYDAIAAGKIPGVKLEDSDA